VYDSNGIPIGNPVDHLTSSNSHIYISFLTIVQPYYIKVTSYSAGSTFQILFNKSATALANGSEAYPYNLTANIWDQRDTTSDYSDVWYSFKVANGTEYNVWWNDSLKGDSTKSLDVKVDAVYSNGSKIFSDRDEAWDTAETFEVDQTGTDITVKLRVYPRDNGKTGSFAIVYSTGSTMPSP
jgi:hypothetical protein